LKETLPFHLQRKNIICYSEYELNKFSNELDSFNIPYAIETITFTEEQKNKVKGKKFNSRTEAIQYLQGEIEEPESEIIPNLKREKAELQQQLQQTEDALLTLMFGN
jgi:hypothetical protein